MTNAEIMEEKCGGMTMEEANMPELSYEEELALVVERFGDSKQQTLKSIIHVVYKSGISFGALHERLLGVDSCGCGGNCERCDDYESGKQEDENNGEDLLF